MSETPLPSADPSSTANGDRTRRRAAGALLLFASALPAGYWLFASLPALWARVEPLGGAVFMLAATLLGAALAIVPLAVLAGFILALWYGVESVYLPRTRPTPLLDRLIVGAGLLVWFAPTLATVALAARALAEGRIHFVRPPRDYFLATDPIAFWQGFGFWLIMGALFAFLAWRYWRGKLLDRRPLAH
ncbi:hypothetical protein [Thauera sinica]|uniref:DUF2062 domain-containing protein n=1 Tax=Thauera sinica TaxID=2665146 RepID=A0ABW1ATN0_9RHOO|nr:hypothetical protein [Thauera sp. K11]